MTDQCTPEEADTAMRQTIEQRLSITEALGDTDTDYAWARSLVARWATLNGGERRGLYRFTEQLVERLTSPKVLP